MRRFKCYSTGQKYTREVERLVRGNLADHVGQSSGGDSETQRVLVATAGPELLGLIAWESPADPTVAKIEVLAVDRSYWRQGVGTALKTEVLAMSAYEGRTFVLSEVHRQNSRMKSLNAKLGVTDLGPLEADGEYRSMGVVVKLSLRDRIRLSRRAA
jgi:GNAT superfamily N-acetyltransferase